MTWVRSRKRAALLHRIDERFSFTRLSSQLTAGQTESALSVLMFHAAFVKQALRAQQKSLVDRPIL